MHAIGMYFAITNSERDQGWADDDERAASLARAEARSMVRREPVRRMGRLAHRLIASSVTALLFVALAAPVSGTSPDGGCGRKFIWIEIPDLLALRPNLPPALAASIDGNGNGALCYFPLPLTISPNSPEFGHLNLVDDRGPAA